MSFQKVICLTFTILMFSCSSQRAQRYLASVEDTAWASAYEDDFVLGFESELGKSSKSTDSPLRIAIELEE